MPNTLTIVFTSAPSTEPVEFQTPNNPGVYVTGTQQANGTWQVVFTGVTKGTYSALTGRLKNYPAVTATIAANNPVANIQQTAPAGTSATGSGATSINVTANSSINATAYRFLSASAQAGPYAVLVTQAGATYNHTGLTAGVTVWYEVQYVGGGFYDDSPPSLAFSGTAAAAALTTYPRLKAGSITNGDSMTTDLTSVTNWVKQYGAAFGFPLNTYANSTDYTTLNNGNVWSATSINNLGSSGSASRKQAGMFLALSPMPSVAPWAGMFGFNNLRLLSTANPLKRYETVNAAHRAVLAVQFMKTVVLPFGGPAGAGTTNFTASRAASLTAGFPTVAMLQDWGSRMVYHRGTTADAAASGWYQPTVVAGETLTFSITGDALAIGTWGCDGSVLTLSRFEVRVDGVLKTTYNPVGRCEVSAVPSNNDAHTQDGLINDAIFLLGLGNTAHTVVLTFLDAGLAGAWDYAAILKTPAEAYYTAAFVLDVPFLSPAAGIGYNYPNPQTTRQFLVDATTSRTANLQSVLPGYPIAFVDIGNRYKPDTVPADTQPADGIHPSTQGHGEIELRLADYSNNDAPAASATADVGTPQAITFPTFTNQANTNGVITTTATVAGFGNTGLSNLVMPANLASSVRVTLAAGAYDAIMLVFYQNSQTGFSSSTALMGFYRGSNNNKIGLIDNGAVTTLTASTPADGNLARLDRTAAGVLSLRLSTDNGANYGPVLATKASDPTQALHIGNDLEKAGIMNTPQGFNLTNPAAAAAATPTVPAGGLNDTPTGSTGHYLTVSEAYSATSLFNAQQVAGIITATNTAGQTAGNFSHYGGFIKKLAAAQNGWIGCEFQADTVNGLLAFSTQNGAADISTNNASFYVDGGTGHLQARNNNTNIDTGYSPIAGDKIRLYVVGSSGQVQLQILNVNGAWRSPSAGGAAFVMSLVATTDLFAHFQLDALTGKIDYAQSGGLVAA